MTDNKQKMLTLRNGDTLPALGLGTWLSRPGEVYQAVRVALEAGYRHIDCAAIYHNQDEVGRAFADAFRAGDLTREDLWVTSKLWNDSHLKDDVRPATQEILRQLQLDYLDLYLIHWPIAFRKGVTTARNPEDFLTLQEAPLEDTWQAMQALKADGLATHIGVSNMGPVRLRLLQKAGEMPAVVQVECHPYLPQTALRDFAAEHQIIITGYSPLGSPGRHNLGEGEPHLLSDPVILGLAEAHDATPAQILIAWALTRGTAVLPKSVNPGRIHENFAALQVNLSGEDMARIDNIGTQWRYLDGSFFSPPGSPYDKDEIYI